MGDYILPFYLVCDQSGSMDSSIEILNNALRQTHDSIASNPIVADRTRFSIIGFAEDAEVLLYLSDLSEITEMPILRARLTTDYGAVFRLLKATIESDVALLTADGHRPYRPAVFFLSDGQPTDDLWRPAFHELIDDSWRYHPNLVAFGFGDAEPAIISEVGTFRAFIASGETTPGAALVEFANTLTKSIVKSGVLMAEDGPVMPSRVEGFISLHGNAA
jgi:uncharacterized protein YegL